MRAPALLVALATHPLRAFCTLSTSLGAMFRHGRAPRVIPRHAVPRCAILPRVPRPHASRSHAFRWLADPRPALWPHKSTPHAIRQASTRPRATSLLAASLLASLLAAPALAVGLPSEMLRDPAAEQRARDIGHELRCLVCQNQSIEESEADLARDLRRIVREQVAAGRSNNQVRDYVHDRYGDFVLLRPPLNAGTLLLWGAPFIILGAGLTAILLSRRRTAGMAPAATPLTAQEQARLAALENERAP